MTSFSKPLTLQNPGYASGLYVNPALDAGSLWAFWNQFHRTRGMDNCLFFNIFTNIFADLQKTWYQLSAAPCFFMRKKPASCIRIHSMPAKKMKEKPCSSSKQKYGNISCHVNSAARSRPMLIALYCEFCCSNKNIKTNLKKMECRQRIPLL